MEFTCRNSGICNLCSLLERARDYRRSKLWCCCALVSLLPRHYSRRFRLRFLPGSYISSHSHLQIYSDSMVGHRMPPGKNMDDYLTMLRSGMWRLSYKLSAEGKKRFFTEFLPLLH